MDRLNALRVYARVVETGSFSAAARDLKVGQPSISKTVAQLEHSVSTRLLVRTTRRLKPTEAGLAFYERARRVLDEVEEAWSTARRASGGLDGRLRVSVPVTFARLHLAPRVGEFLALHPQLAVDFIMDDRNVDLFEAGIDVALRLGALPDSTLSARKLASCPRLVLASREYVKRAGRASEPADLLEHTAIVYSQTAGGDEWRFRRGTAETSVRIRSRLSFSAAEGVRAAVNAGLGLAMVSRWMMAPELEAGSVVPLLRDWSLPPMDLWAVYPTGRMPTAKARAFVTWFASLIAERP